MRYCYKLFMNIITFIGSLIIIKYYKNYKSVYCFCSNLYFKNLKIYVISNLKTLTVKPQVQTNHRLFFCL